MTRAKHTYGWITLTVAALAMVATLPGRTQGLGLVTEPLLSDLGVDRVTFASINLWATLIGASFCLPCGRLIDRWGVRVVLTGVTAALAATVLVMSRAASLPLLAVTITLTRGFGQSALSVVSLVIVGKWFKQNLNYAMGVYSVIVGLGFIAAFPLVGSVVLQSGWRVAWAGIGWTLACVFVPAAWLLVRNSPPDEAVQAGDIEPTHRPGEVDLNLGDALRGSAFWLFALSSAMFGLVYSGISLFNQSILEQHGFDASTYHTVLVISTLVGLLANFAGGWIASFWPIQRLMGVGMAVLAAALCGLPMVRTFAHVVAYGITMGVAGGVVTVTFFSVWGQVYGRSHLGKIQGCAQMMTVFASAIGPLLLAETLKVTGSYDSMFLGLAAVVSALGIGSWFVPLPSREVENRTFAIDAI
jgi:MFS family permease